MALNPTGPISLGTLVAGQSLQYELSMTGTATISLNDAAVRSLGDVTTSRAQISLSNFYNKITAKFGTFWGSWYSGYSQAVGVEKIDYATSTYSATSMTYSVTTDTSARVSSSTLGILVNNVPVNAAAQKTTEMYGAYFATLTRVSFSASVVDHNRCPSIRSGTLGWVIGGINVSAGMVTATQEVNLVTLTNASITSQVTTQTACESGFDGLTNGYMSFFNSAGTAMQLCKFNNATKTTIYTALTMPNWPGASNPVATSISPTVGYIHGDSLGSLINKWNRSTDTNTTASLAGSPWSGSFIYATRNGYNDCHACSSSLKAFFCRGYDVNSGATYNNGFTLTYATDTWTTGYAVYSAYQAGVSGAYMGVDPTWILSA